MQAIIKQVAIDNYMHVAIYTRFKIIAMHAYNLHLIVIPWARVVCLIYTPEARGPQARGLRVYISGKPRVHMV